MTAEACHTRAWRAVELAAGTDSSRAKTRSQGRTAGELHPDTPDVRVHVASKCHVVHARPTAIPPLITKEPLMQKRQSINIVTPEGEYRRAMRLTVAHRDNGYTMLVRVMFSNAVIRIPLSSVVQ